MKRKVGLLTRTFDDVISEYYTMLKENGVDNTVLDNAVKIVDSVRNEVGHRGIMFLASVYIASIKKGTPIPQRDLATIAEVTETSIRKWYRKICNKLKLKIKSEHPYRRII